jgi:ferredoxin-thioredoxin reductase catalytic chain
MVNNSPLVQAGYDRIRRDAEDGGYHLNPDEAWCKGLISGLLVNQDRYGYQACPCRLAVGNKSSDLDIICPCDYRDPDLTEYGACYCALYVSDEVLEGIRPLTSVPERRPMNANLSTAPSESATTGPQTAGIKVWRCRVCGYLCAREHPPGVCPVCKAKGERFELFRMPE